MWSRRHETCGGKNGRRGATEVPKTRRICADVGESPEKTDERYNVGKDRQSITSGGQGAWPDLVALKKRLPWDGNAHFLLVATDVLVAQMPALDEHIVDANVVPWVTTHWIEIASREEKEAIQLPERGVYSLGLHNGP